MQWNDSLRHRGLFCTNNWSLGGKSNKLGFGSERVTSPKKRKVHWTSLLFDPKPKLYLVAGAWVAGAAGLGAVSVAGVAVAGATTAGGELA